MTPSPNLNLIAAHLEGLEETIISKLIDRAQFKFNAPIYQAGESGFNEGGDLSLFDLRLRMHEEMDAQFGRFFVPEERPFYKNLPESRRVVSLPETCLVIEDFERVSQNAEIKKSYLDMLPKVCCEGDDGHYGSSVEHDVYVLQAIARRIHYGSLYVAESKFSNAPDDYSELIKAGDEKGLLRLLTRKEVEDRILIRIRDKVDHLQAGVNLEVRHVIDPEIITTYYRDWIIPLTKKGEIAYLLQRKVS